MRISRSFAKTMTAARQQRKPPPRLVSVVAGVLSLLPAALVSVSPAASTERLVVDRHTGLAIGGYDPVAYYTDGKPTPGSPELEIQYAGAVWRFRNIGDREAFVAHPDVYMPQFGGYDPLGVARGVAVAGNPNVWLIAHERLYLFYDRDRLATFAADPNRVAEAASRKWPDVRRTLTP
jgi:hypothetical protein